MKSHKICFLVFLIILISSNFAIASTCSGSNKITKCCSIAQDINNNNYVTQCSCQGLNQQECNNKIYSCTWENDINTEDLCLNYNTMDDCNSNNKCNWIEYQDNVGECIPLLCKDKPCNELTNDEIENFRPDCKEFFSNDRCSCKQTNDLTDFCPCQTTLSLCDSVSGCSWDYLFAECFKPYGQDPDDPSSSASGINNNKLLILVSAFISLILSNI